MNIDTSMFENYKYKQIYYIEDLQDSLRSLVLTQIWDHFATEESGINDIDSKELANFTFELLREQIGSHYPESPETEDNLMLRSQKTKKIIKLYLDKHPILGGDKVLLVSHYTFLKMYTMRKRDEGDSDGGK